MRHSVAHYKCQIQTPELNAFENAVQTQAEQPCITPGYGMRRLPGLPALHGTPEPPSTEYLLFYRCKPRGYPICSDRKMASGYVDHAQPERVHEIA